MRFSAERHGLEVQLENQTPLIPRQRVSTVAYAFKANNVPDGAITTSKIADGAVTTPKIADSAVTSAKLATDVASLSKVSGGVITGDGTKISVAQPLTTNGLIESLLGGFQFPDGTIQTTAATTNGGGPQVYVTVSDQPSGLQIFNARNVASVQRLNVNGRYRITFTQPLRDAHYTVVAAGDQSLLSFFNKTTGFIEIQVNQLFDLPESSTKVLLPQFGNFDLAIFAP